MDGMGLVCWPSAYLSIFDEVRVAVLEQRSMIEQRWELRNSILTSVFPVENVFFPRGLEWRIQFLQCVVIFFHWISIS